MKRRKFLENAALTGAAFSFLGPLNTLGEPVVKAALPLTSTLSFDFEEFAIRKLQDGLHAGSFTSKYLTVQYIDRIQNIDQKGPGVNAVLKLNPEAVDLAQKMDDERKKGHVRGPLHGIPILIKDNIDTHDQMPCTAGSLALAENYPERDAFIVGKLRDAGAIILGKTNLSEWANFRSSRSSSGWSAVGGQTHNPYILDRSPCGSSSGSGAAVAANLCAAALGTETDGSVICPSSINGIVGLKPTIGLLSRSGIVPISHTQDTAGPMARNVEDIAILLSALAGSDPNDPYTINKKHIGIQDYTVFLKADGLSNARIGVARDFFGFHDKVDDVMEEALKALEAGGATLVDIKLMPQRQEAGEAEFQVLLFEFKADLNKYLSGTSGRVPVKSLKDLIAFNEAHKDREMPYFGQELFLSAQSKGTLNAAEYIKALEKSLKISRESIDKAMTENKLHAIVAPSESPAWPIDLIDGDHYIGGSSSPAAQSGYPNITVPAGFIEGLPVGISFFGAAFSESVLLKLAYAFEQSTNHRKPPQFIPSFKY